jgi:hypothetical protein
MTPNFAHKLLNAEIPPPDSAWHKIASELDKLEGTGFVHKVTEASINPPEEVWKKVAAALDPPRTAKTFTLSRTWVKWTAAALVFGIIAVTAFNFLASDKNRNSVTAGTSETKNDTALTPRRNNNNSDASSTGAASSITSSVGLADNGRQLPSRKGSLAARDQSQNPPRHAVIESAGIEKQDFLNTEAEPRISSNVSSTPANIIPAPEYFVVMAPNGEKVRISSKFSDAVTSLYGGDNVDYFWKTRFDSWKSKLMTNPSFIPSAGNFLDIVELKDMLKEQ